MKKEWLEDKQSSTNTYKNSTRKSEQKKGVQEAYSHCESFRQLGASKTHRKKKQILNHFHKNSKLDKKQLYRELVGKVQAELQKIMSVKIEKMSIEWSLSRDQLVNIPINGERSEITVSQKHLKILTKSIHTFKEFFKFVNLRRLKWRRF